MFNQMGKEASWFFYILKFSKIGFNQKKIKTIREVHYIFLKGINITKDGIVNCIIFALNTWSPTYVKEIFLKLKWCNNSLTTGQILNTKLNREIMQVSDSMNMNPADI